VHFVGSARKEADTNIILTGGTHCASFPAQIESTARLRATAPNFIVRVVLSFMACYEEAFSLIVYEN
jgi:hypothetical protein